METMSQFNQVYMSKKAINIVLSLVLVLSFVLVSYSTVFLSFLSIFSMNLFSYSSERNYIFLLCNGILVFLIKNSGFVTNSAIVTDHIKYSQAEKTTEEEKEEKITQSESPVSVSDNENWYPCDKHDEEKQEHLLDIQEDDNNYCNNNDDDDDYKEDEGIEELNRRCEEFIRRMKQDIKTEATY